MHKKLGGKDKRPGPIKALKNIKVVAIDCGRWHSAALTGNLESHSEDFREWRNLYMRWRWDTV